MVTTFHLVINFTPIRKESFWKVNCSDRHTSMAKTLFRKQLPCNIQSLFQYKYDDYDVHAYLSIKWCTLLDYKILDFIEVDIRIYQPEKIIVIITTTLFQKDNTLGTSTSLTHSPQLQLEINMSFAIDKWTLFTVILFTEAEVFFGLINPYVNRNWSQ